MSSNEDQEMVLKEEHFHSQNNDEEQVPAQKIDEEHQKEERKKDQEVTRLFRVHRTMMQMLRDRGYVVQDSDINMTKQEFKEKYKFDCKQIIVRSNLKIRTVKTNDPADQIFVFFPDVESLKKNVIKSLVDTMKTENVIRAIVVTPQDTPIRLNGFTGQFEEFYVEAFQLLVNVTENALVPKHQLLTDEAKKLLKKYSITELQLPQIRISGPIARYYGAKAGQVMMITRPSETATEEYVVFRYVY